MLPAAIRTLHGSSPDDESGLDVLENETYVISTSMTVAFSGSQSIAATEGRHQRGTRP